MKKEKPTKPGWWWYEDKYYDLAPIYVDWTGFINIELIVDLAVGEDQEMLGQLVSDLDGNWYPLIEPKIATE